MKKIVLEVIIILVKFIFGDKLVEDVLKEKSEQSDVALEGTAYQNDMTSYEFNEISEELLDMIDYDDESEDDDIYYKEFGVVFLPEGANRLVFFEIMDKEIGNLELGLREYNTLRRAGIDNVFALLEMKKDEMLKISNMRLVMVKRIAIALMKSGYYHSDLMGDFKDYDGMTIELACDYLEKTYYPKAKGLSDEEVKESLEKQLEKKKAKRREKLDNLISDFDKLIGLENVKNQVEDMVIHTLISELKGGKQKGFVPNMVFTGNPGTGKTTVANKISEIYNCLNMNNKAKVVVASRKDFCGRYAGETAQKTSELFNSALGGVLFVDEAYSLYKKESEHDSYGAEAINTLTGLMTQHEGEICVIFAGYRQEMDEMFNASNAGLKERFPYTIHFEDYNDDDLLKIMKYMLSKENLSISEDCDSLMREAISLKKRLSGKCFSNARAIKNLLQHLIKHQERRLYEKYKLGDMLSAEELVSLEKIDIESLILELKEEFEKELDMKNSYENTIRRIGFAC